MRNVDVIFALEISDDPSCDIYSIKSKFHSTIALLHLDFTIIFVI